MTRRFTLIYYGLLVTVAVAVSLAVFSAGESARAERSVAGGYEVLEGADCLGTTVQLRQSGQFVTLERGGASLGQLRLRDGVLAGDVSCRRGDDVPIEARAAAGKIAGDLGGRPLRAELRSDPPAPGTRPAVAPDDISGNYKLVPRSDCLGGTLEIHGDSGTLDFEGSGAARGSMRFERGRIRGTARCDSGEQVVVSGQAADRVLELTLAARAGAPSGPAERIDAQRTREFGKTMAAFFLAVAVVMLAARLAGAAITRIGQPRVMGEVAAGIILGPTVIGAVLPEVQRALFPSDVVPFIGVVANLGLIFYMFLVGLELDVRQLQGRVLQAVTISGTGVVVPMLVGMAVALPTYELVGPDNGFAGFAVFMGVSMSITAVPVLARILEERRMLKRPVGALTLASAAIDHLVAWVLIAIAIAIALAGSVADVIRTISLAAAFCLIMGFGGRRVVRRAANAYDRAGRVPINWITGIFAGVLVSAYITEEIGIALIFGAFIMGAIMPRHVALTEDVTHRVEDFVVLLLLPLYFAYTGLRTNVGLLDSPELILLTVALIAVAIACKFGGCMIAARASGIGWRESAVIGSLMNARGLTELIVLNLALEKGVISEALFASLVIMALVTTFMTGPLLTLLDPRNEFGEPVKERSLGVLPASRT